MKDSVSLSKRSLTMREFWKYDHLSVEEIEQEIASLDREVMYFSSIEKFLKADELQKEIEFLKEIAKRKALETFKKQNKIAVKKIENTCHTNKMDICRSWNQKIEKLHREMNLGIARIDNEYQFKQRKLFSNFKQQESLGSARNNPAIIDINYLMPRLIERRRFKEANALKTQRKNEQQKVSAMTRRDMKNRFESKLKELGQRREREKLRFKDRLQEKIDDMHTDRSQELSKFEKFCDAKRVKASHQSIVKFAEFEKKVSLAALPRVKEEIKRYGTSLRNWTTFSKSMLRKTIAF